MLSTILLLIVSFQYSIQLAVTDGPRVKRQQDFSTALGPAVSRFRTSEPSITDISSLSTSTPLMRGTISFTSTQVETTTSDNSELNDAFPTPDPIVSAVPSSIIFISLILALISYIFMF